ncbi:MAG TPA: plastocyanin/azurin family copper-binding protein [Gemmatimonadales bacterium]|nr:plastocyanin/azurin family copper-binding protein [Gemmatimonadales bacterium]
MIRRALSVLLVCAAAVPLGAQSLMYRPPNLGGTWVPDGGVVQFHVSHRFYVAPAAGSHKITNFPTFTLALGLGRDLAIGTHYGTNSFVVQNPYRPNETEAYARWRVIGGEGKDGFAVSVTPAYNFAAHSADGELGVDYTVGRLTLSGAARGMSKAFGVDTARAAFAGGVAARVTDYIALSADVGSFVSPAVRAAWSVAVDFVIPGSPHTFSLQASNATTSTIEGNSIGFGKMLYGFEFTIPLHLKRFAPWFHGSPKPVAFGAPAGTAVAADVRMTALKFRADTVTISAGQAVRWTNDDPLEHTVTFAGAEAGSPPIPSHGTYVRRFDQPGTYAYHCTPHPFMTGVVVVK